MRFGGGSNIASHYTYPNPSQAHSGAGLPPPSLAANPNFITQSSLANSFALNGNSIGLGANFGPGGMGMPAGGTGLGSQQAQMSFASAALHQSHNGMVDGHPRAAGTKGRIREVWKGNLAEEMAVLRQLVDKYPYIAMVRLYISRSACTIPG